MAHSRLPLGKHSAYPDAYAPGVLFAIARSKSRADIGITAEMPFRGTDVWNAWELTWLGAEDRPSVATAEIRLPADSPNLIESKSLKLYLNSFSMSHFDSSGIVADTIAGDLAKCAGTEVDVRVALLADSEDRYIGRLAGQCMDTLSVRCCAWQVDADLLQADATNIVEEVLHTHLLRSLCPVTSQPDTGSLQINYRGPRIAPESLLQYVVSFRQHKDFHEACVERMFVDIVRRCNVDRLSVYARYQRRGGIDINPFRSNFEDCPGNPRLWQQ